MERTPSNSNLTPAQQPTPGQEVESKEIIWVRTVKPVDNEILANLVGRVESLRECVDTALPFEGMGRIAAHIQSEVVAVPILNVRLQENEVAPNTPPLLQPKVPQQSFPPLIPYFAGANVMFTADHCQGHDPHTHKLNPRELENLNPVSKKVLLLALRGQLKESKNDATSSQADRLIKTKAEIEDVALKLAVAEKKAGRFFRSTEDKMTIAHLKENLGALKTHYHNLKSTENVNNLPQIFSGREAQLERDKTNLLESKKAELTQVSASIKEIKSGWNRLSFTRSRGANQELQSLKKQQAKVSSDLAKLDENGFTGNLIQNIYLQKLNNLQANIALVETACRNDDKINVSGQDKWIDDVKADVPEFIKELLMGKQVNAWEIFQKEQEFSTKQALNLEIVKDWVDTHSNTLPPNMRTVLSQLPPISLKAAQEYGLDIGPANKPPFFSEVAPGLLLGNQNAYVFATKDSKFANVLSLRDNAGQSDPEINGHRHLIALEQDFPGSRVENEIVTWTPNQAKEHFDTCHSVIKQGIIRGGILVQCQEGKSRSASAVIAYLMKEYNMPLAVAYEMVRGQRPMIEPTPEWTAMLGKYQEFLGISGDWKHMITEERKTQLLEDAQFSFLR